ncbi:MAG: zinc ribbon domain-containing protein [Solirubrobacterales bacterium]
MAPAIFGISNNGLNLAVSLIFLMLVVVWLALIVYTYLDARRRISDQFLVGCATIASFIPFLGTAVYAILRPPEFLEDAHERELEIRAAELRVRQLKELSCPKCTYPIEKSYLRCPRCQQRLKDPCPACGKPVDPRWALCPYCETAFPERQRQRRQRKSEGRKQSGGGERQAPTEGERRPKRQPSRKPAAEATDAERADSPTKKPSTAPQPQRSESRESHPDPRQA